MKLKSTFYEESGAERNQILEAAYEPWESSEPVEKVTNSLHHH